MLSEVGNPIKIHPGILGGPEVVVPSEGFWAVRREPIESSLILYPPLLRTMCLYLPSLQFVPQTLSVLYAGC
jgi:hypothetical protein